MTTSKDEGIGSVDRRYPSWPILGVAGAVVNGGKILLVRRGREPMMGSWTLPGGALATGETMLEGVTREVREETGLAVRPLELLALLDRIVRDESGAVEYHYVLMDWLCVLDDTDGAEGQVACAGSDALEVAWVDTAGLDDLLELDEATQRVALDALSRVVRA